MSLALVQVPLSDFHELHEHLTTFTRHGNMHLREARYEKKRRLLRYLHAMYANSSFEIEGMISGPGVFWHYKLKLVGGRTQMQVLTHNCSPSDDARLGRRFLTEILTRMQKERARTEEVFPKLTQGQFYLRRSTPGMRSTHPNCQNAVSTGALDRSFVSQLRAWNLELLNP